MKRSDDEGTPRDFLEAFLATMFILGVFYMLVWIFGG